MHTAEYSSFTRQTLTSLRREDASAEHSYCLPTETVSANEEAPRPLTRKRIRKGSWSTNFISVKSLGWSPIHFIQVVRSRAMTSMNFYSWGFNRNNQLGSYSLSTNGANDDSLGQRPRTRAPLKIQALKGRNNTINSPDMVKKGGEE